MAAHGPNNYPKNGLQIAENYHCCVIFPFLGHFPTQKVPKKGPKIDTQTNRKPSYRQTALCHSRRRPGRKGGGGKGSGGKGSGGKDKAWHSELNRLGVFSVIFYCGGVFGTIFSGKMVPGDMLFMFFGAPKHTQEY